MFDRTECPNAIFVRDCIGPVHIGIDDSNQANWFSLLLELAIDSRMVASEGTHAYDSYIDWMIRSRGHVMGVVRRP